MIDSLLEHPLWPEIKPFIILHPSVAQSRWRINIDKTIPFKLWERASQIQIKCANAKCSKLISPLRLGKVYGMYVSVSCPQSISLDCSRSRGSRNECRKIQESILNFSKGLSVRQLIIRLQQLSIDHDMQVMLPSENGVIGIEQADIFFCSKDQQIVDEAEACRQVIVLQAVLEDK